MPERDVYVVVEQDDRFPIENVRVFASVSEAEAWMDEIERSGRFSRFFLAPLED